MPINGQKFTLISFFFEVNQLYFHGVQEKLCFFQKFSSPALDWGWVAGNWEKAKKKHPVLNSPTYFFSHFSIFFSNFISNLERGQRENEGRDIERNRRKRDI